MTVSVAANAAWQMTRVSGEADGRMEKVGARREAMDLESAVVEGRPEACKSRIERECRSRRGDKVSRRGVLGPAAIVKDASVSTKNC